MVNTPSFSYKEREQFIRSLSGGNVLVTIIGGGITGAGIANLLAQNGLKPVLLERSDFSSGTSSGSSKLIHGGLRYLAEGRIGLTRHLLKERNYMLKHLDIVKRMRFDILVDSYSWSRNTIRFGLFFYGLLGSSLRIPRMHENAGKYPQSVRGYFEYHDAFTIDSVLVIHNILSAVVKGARCINYAPVISLEKTGDNFLISFVDRLTGGVLSFRSRYIINSAGPWVRTVDDMISLSPKGRFRLSKGVHLVFRSEAVPIKNAVAFRTPVDGRQMFLIPAGKVTIAGTTDTFTDSPDDFSVEEQDRSYVMKSVEHIFPNVGRGDIVAEYSGIRPLFGEGKTPGEISRDFFISRYERSISVYGGKLTDYRNVARKVSREFERISGIQIKSKRLPEVFYRRPEGKIKPSYFINHECAITPEDVYRRRTAYAILDPENQGVKEEIFSAFDRLGHLAPKQ